MTGEVPPSMSGTCGCSLNSHMYIFGGFNRIEQTNQVRLVSGATMMKLMFYAVHYMALVCMTDVMQSF